MVSMADKPGELAKITKKLARGGVNTSTPCSAGTHDPPGRVAMTVDRMEEAKRLLDFS